MQSARKKGKRIEVKGCTPDQPWVRIARKQEQTLEKLAKNDPKKPPREADRQEDLFKTRLEDIIDMDHEMVRLAGFIDWDKLDREFGAMYHQSLGREGLPTRLMAGLHYIKEAFGVSDEGLMLHWVENPYWQHFCGMKYFEHKPPMSPTALGKWRKRIGPDKMEQLLAVTDTGAGMDDKTLSRVFEPFFTTKPKGKGTGLGLSTVYGIIKQSGGNIWVYSEPGRGTTVKIYLPRAEKEAAASNGAAKEAADIELRGTETVMIAEDEEHVRRVAVRALGAHGYTVLEARDGLEALTLADNHDGPIHLLLTDVVMPGPSGRETSDTLLERIPGLKVVYMSGYTDNAIVHHGVLDEGLHFIQKPFAIDKLLRTVRGVLDRG